MNTSVKANVMSPKLIRGALAHTTGVSSDCGDEADPVPRRISSTKNTMSPMNNAKNRTNKNTAKVLLKAMFMLLTDPEKVGA